MGRIEHEHELEHEEEEEEEDESESEPEKCELAGGGARSGEWVVLEEVPHHFVGVEFLGGISDDPFAILAAGPSVSAADDPNELQVRNVRLWVEPIAMDFDPRAVGFAIWPFLGAADKRWVIGNLGAGSREEFFPGLERLRNA